MYLFYEQRQKNQCNHCCNPQDKSSWSVAFQTKGGVYAGELGKNPEQTII